MPKLTVAQRKILQPPYFTTKADESFLNSWDERKTPLKEIDDKIKSGNFNLEAKDTAENQLTKSIAKASLANYTNSQALEIFELDKLHWETQSTPAGRKYLLESIQSTGSTNPDKTEAYKILSDNLSAAIAPTFSTVEKRQEAYKKLCSSSSTNFEEFDKISGQQKGENVSKAYNACLLGCLKESGNNLSEDNLELFNALTIQEQEKIVKDHLTHLLSSPETGVKEKAEGSLKDLEEKKAAFDILYSDARLNQAQQALSTLHDSKGPTREVFSKADFDSADANQKKELLRKALIAQLNSAPLNPPIPDNTPASEVIQWAQTNSTPFMKQRISEYEMLLHAVDPADNTFTLAKPPAPAAPASADKPLEIGLDKSVGKSRLPVTEFQPAFEAHFQALGGTPNFEYTNSTDLHTVYVSQKGASKPFMEVSHEKIVIPPPTHMTVQDLAKAAIAAILSTNIKNLSKIPMTGGSQALRDAIKKEAKTHHPAIFAKLEDREELKAQQLQKASLSSHTKQQAASQPSAKSSFMPPPPASAPPIEEPSATRTPFFN